MTEHDEQLAQQAQVLEQRLEREQQVSDFLWLMNDPRGRRFMWRTISQCRIFLPSLGPTDAATNFNEGQRNVGLFHLGEIQDLCPALFAVMASENAPKPIEEQTQETDE